MTYLRQIAVFFLLSFSLMTHAEDPRPRIVILGESSSLPVRGSLPWTGVLTRKHPEWRVINLSQWDALAGESLEVPHKKKTKTLPGWNDTLETTMEGIDGADMVLVMLGLTHSRKEVLEKIPPRQAAEGLRALLKTGKGHPKTKEAAWVVVTPLPIVPSRLDQWSTPSFADSVEANAQLAEMWRKVATEENVQVIDAHSWILEQGNGGDAVMSAGWMVRWNGIAKLGDWMTAQIEVLDPQPQDPEAFTVWKQVQASHAELDAILENTGGGRPATGVVLASTRGVPQEEGKKKKKKVPPQRFQVPVSAIEPGRLSLLVEAEGSHLATMGSGSDSYARPYLELTLASGEVKKIPHNGTDWQYITELSPDQPLTDRRFGVSIGKWRPMILVDGREGQVRQALLSFSLPPLDQDDVTSLTLVVPDNGRRTYFQEEIDGKANALKSPGSYGSLRIHTLMRPDSLWDSSVATWETRDGKHAWTGGAVNTTLRKQELKTFLNTHPPADVRARAETYLP